jgi:hypothetical protein
LSQRGAASTPPTSTNTDASEAIAIARMRTALASRAVFTGFSASAAIR